MAHAEHHIHQRKRIHQLYQKFPHPNPTLKFLDNICIMIAIIMPLTTFPQIYKTWVYKNAIGMSLLMWVFHAMLVIPMLLYGIAHKVKPLIILNILWVVVDIIVIIGIMLYG